MDMKALQAEFPGELFTPRSADQEVPRRISNARIDRRPTAIQRSRGGGTLSLITALRLE